MVTCAFAAITVVNCMILLFMSAIHSITFNFVMETTSMGMERNVEVVYVPMLYYLKKCFLILQWNMLIIYTTMPIFVLLLVLPVLYILQISCLKTLSIGIQVRL